MERDYKLFLKLLKHVARILDLKYTHLNAYRYFHLWNIKVKESAK